MAISLIALLAVIGTVLGVTLTGGDGDDDTRAVDGPVTESSDSSEMESDEPVDYGSDVADDSAYAETTDEDESYDEYGDEGGDRDALTVLHEIAASDEVNVEEISGQWTVQLSSKTDGTEAGGRVYRYDDILALHEDFEALYSTALLVYSSGWGSYELDDYWATLLGKTFSTSRNALLWCRHHGYDADGVGTDDCAAKRVSRNGNFRKDFDVWPPGN